MPWTLATRHSCRLQWSRPHLRTETTPPALGDPIDCTASMEPSSFEDGDVEASLAITADRFAASMEPSSFEDGDPMI